MSKERMEVYRGILTDNNIDDEALPPEILREFALSDDDVIRCEVASYWDTGAKLLKLLSRDPSDMVRSYVASAEYCPLAVLFRLAEDIDPQVRQAVLANPRCPQEIKLWASGTHGMSLPAFMRNLGAIGWAR